MERLRDPGDDEDTLARSKFSRSAQSLFEYSPLNLDAPTIRLVRVLADLSSDGLIQLEIRHASTKSTYSCLSYVWGREKTLHWIRLGKRLFQVRHNLRAFLQTARKKPHVCSEWLWIDALCIDQSNNCERSHQVQQMGHIFSRAVRVISWLGDDEVIARFFRESTQPLKLDALDGIKKTSPGCLRFLQSDYWARAWITQEIALAHLITFMAGNEEIDRLQQPEEIEDGAILSRDLKPVYVLNYSRQWKGRSLIYLLQMFSRKDCRNRCDRIFSLLGLCSEGSDLDVDYDISYDTLAMRVLQVCDNSFCLCAVRLLDRVLHLAEPETAVVEKQLFATLSMSTSDRGINCIDPTEVRLHISAFCPLFSNDMWDEVCVTISRGTCYRVQNTDKKCIVYYNKCNILIEGRRSKKRREEVRFHYSYIKPNQVSWGNSVSYDRNAKMWNITFPFATLVNLARMEATSNLCTRGRGADAASVKAKDELGLRLSSGSDLYTDAPDLSLSTEDNPLSPSIQDLLSVGLDERPSQDEDRRMLARLTGTEFGPEFIREFRSLLEKRLRRDQLRERLRSFEVRPYIDEHDQSQLCGVFVFDRDNDSVDTS